MKKTAFFGLVLIAVLMTGCKLEVEVAEIMNFQITKDSQLADIQPVVKIFNMDKNGIVTLEDSELMVTSNLIFSASCFDGEKLCWGAYYAADGLEWGCGDKCDKNLETACTPCQGGKTIVATLVPSAPVTGTMTWTIVKEKNTANPIINFYDVDDAKKAVKTGVALDDATTTTSFTCTLGNIICIGADFEVAGEQFAIGCAEACADYEDYKTELTATKECQACVNGNAATVTYSNFLF